MNDQARHVWRTPEGVSLFAKMLAGSPLDAGDRRTLDALKRADPPRLAQADDGAARVDRPVSRA